MNKRDTLMSLEGTDERLVHRTIPPVSSTCPVTEPREEEKVNEDEDDYYDSFSYSYSYDYTYTYTYTSNTSLQREFIRLESEKNTRSLSYDDDN